MRCIICRDITNHYFCNKCSASFDRATAKDDGTIMAMIKWAAARARRMAKKAKR